MMEQLPMFDAAGVPTIYALPAPTRLQFWNTARAIAHRANAWLQAEYAQMWVEYLAGQRRRAPDLAALLADQQRLISHAVDRLNGKTPTSGEGK